MKKSMFVFATPERCKDCICAESLGKDENGNWKLVCLADKSFHSRFIEDISIRQDWCSLIDLPSFDFDCADETDEYISGYVDGYQALEKLNLYKEEKRICQTKEEK